jgi:hypothetical protein
MLIPPPKTLTVHVTQGDIDAGIKVNATSCPVARALRRQFAWASVGPSTLKVADIAPSPHVRYKLPEEGTAFILAFDTGEDVSPISFDATFAEVEA